MSHEIKNEPKVELAHDEHLGNDGGTGKMAGLLSKKDEIRDGDLGARWLEEYTGPRGELNDEENNRIRNKVGNTLEHDEWLDVWANPRDIDRLQPHADVSLEFAVDHHDLFRFRWSGVQC